jgi:hypothetical protein
MNKRMVGVLAASAVLTLAAPAAAQDRARVSGSESSFSTGPTCVVGGVVSDCGVGAASGGFAFGPGPVIVGAFPVVGPVIGPVFGGAEGGRAGTDTDVDRSTRNGNAVAR